MLRFAKWLPCVGALTGAAMLGTANPTRADFDVELSFGGQTVLIDVTKQTVTASGGATTSGATILYGNGTVMISNLNVGGFIVGATIADSNSPGGPTASTIDLSSLSIKNSTGISGDSTLTITSGDTGFTFPQNNANVTSTMSATAAGSNSGSATVTFNSYLDTNNGELSTSGPSVFGTPTINLAVGAGKSASDNSTLSLMNGVTDPYSLTEVEKLTLANGDSLIDGSSGTTVMASEPNSMMTALSALPLLCLGIFLRRPRQIAVA